MDLSKLSPADKIIAGSGVALLMLSIVPWFGLLTGPLKITHDAWDNPLTLLAVLIGIVMAAQVIVSLLPNAKMPNLPIGWGQLHLILGGLALLLVLIQCIVGDEYTVYTTFELERKIGLFLGLLASAGLAYGGFRKSKEPEAAPGIIP